MADNNDRRRPRDMQGLLNFCTELTKAEDAPNPSTAIEISQEVSRLYSFLRLKNY